MMKTVSELVGEAEQMRIARIMSGNLLPDFFEFQEWADNQGYCEEGMDMEGLREFSPKLFQVVETQYAIDILESFSYDPVGTLDPNYPEVIDEITNAMEIVYRANQSISFNVLSERFHAGVAV